MPASGVIDHLRGLKTIPQQRFRQDVHAAVSNAEVDPVWAGGAGRYQGIDDIIRGAPIGDAVDSRRAKLGVKVRVPLHGIADPDVGDVTVTVMNFFLDARPELGLVADELLEQHGGRANVPKSLQDRLVDQVLHDDDRVQSGCHAAGIGIAIQPQTACGTVAGIHYFVADQLPSQEKQGVVGVELIGVLWNVDPMQVFLGDVAAVEASGDGLGRSIARGRSDSTQTATGNKHHHGNHEPCRCGQALELVFPHTYTLSHPRQVDRT